MPLTVGATIDGDLGAVPDTVRRLDALGVDAVWVGETQHNPFLPLVLAAEHAPRMRLGTSVAIAFPRVPHVTANIAWDLARYSGGRFTLGLGTQVKAHNERRFSVPWAPPGPRLRDYIACMRAIWDSWQHGTRPNYEGEFYQYRLTSPFFNPGPIDHPEIPVIISAVNTFNARLAGEVCDGIALHPFSTFAYIREVLLPALEEGVSLRNERGDTRAGGARTAGKDASRLQVLGGGFIVTGRTDAEVAEAREATRRQIAFYGSTRSYARVMQHHGWDDAAAQLHCLSLDGRWDDMTALVTDDMLEQFCAIATWDALPSAVRAKYAGLVTQVALTAAPRTPDEEAQLREVVAAIKGVPAYGELP